MTGRKTAEEAVIELRRDLSKGFSAVKVMLDERMVRVERLEKQLVMLEERNVELRTTLAVLSERVANHRENTGQFRTEIVKDRIEDFRDDKRIGVEKWKATAPVIVALIAGIFAVITSLVSVVLNLTGGR